MTVTPVRADPTTVPPEIDRWNWGAFLLNWIWGIGNNTFIALLTLVPGLGIIMMLVLGFKGSRWAWRNGRWDSIEHFKRTQRLWAIWGVVLWLGLIALIGGIFGSALYLLRNSGAYELGVSTLQTNADAIAILGTPIATGIPFGSVSSNQTSGKTALDFSASGPKASGRIFMESVKQDGVWSLKNLRLKIDGREDAIDLLKQSRAELGGFRALPFVIASEAKQSIGPQSKTWIASLRSQ
jgi:hypothetical protein